MSLVAFDRGREKHTGGGTPTAGRDHPSWPRTSAQLKRQSRAGQLRGLRQHFYRQAVDAQADQPLRVLAYSGTESGGPTMMRIGGTLRG